MNIREEYSRSLKMLEVEEVLDLILYRPLALVFVRFVYKTPLTPNGVTIMSLLSGLVAAYCFAQGTVSGMAWGGIWYAIANVLDCSDGQLARLQGSGSPLGRLIDGVVDWIISVAVFSGLAIGIQRTTGDASIWWIVSAAGISSALHAFFFDLYQQQFIANVRGQENFVDRELVKVRSLLGMSNGPFKVFILSIYLTYLEAQAGSRSREAHERQFPADLYRERNKNVMRFWTLLGPTTNRSLLIVAGLLNSTVIFLWPVVIVGNVLLIIALIWQRSVLRKLDEATKSLAMPVPQRTSIPT